METELFLNDEIINNYMELITNRSPDTVYTFNTFFFLALSTQGYNRVDRWTKHVDIFSKKKIIIPIHIIEEKHWVLVCVNFEKKIIEFYDSLGGDGYDLMKVIVSYLLSEGASKKNIHFCLDNWRLKNITDCPQQENYWDCGVFVCMFAEHLARDAPFNFTQDNMVELRNQISLEIKTKKLIMK